MGMLDGEAGGSRTATGGSSTTGSNAPGATKSGSIGSASSRSASTTGGRTTGGNVASSSSRSTSGGNSNPGARSTSNPGGSTGLGGGTSRGGVGASNGGGNAPGAARSSSTVGGNARSGGSPTGARGPIAGDGSARQGSGRVSGSPFGGAGPRGPTGPQGQPRSNVGPTRGIGTGPRGPMGSLGPRQGGGRVSAPGGVFNSPRNTYSGPKGNPRTGLNAPAYGAFQGTTPKTSGVQPAGGIRDPEYGFDPYAAARRGLVENQLKYERDVMSNLGMRLNTNLQPTFHGRLFNTIVAADNLGLIEKQMQQKGRIFNELTRTPETSAQYYANYKGRPFTYNGKTYSPQYKGNIAAPPLGLQPQLRHGG